MCGSARFSSRSAISPFPAAAWIPWLDFFRASLASRAFPPFLFVQPLFHLRFETIGTNTRPFVLLSFPVTLFSDRTARALTLSTSANGWLGLPIPFSAAHARNIDDPNAM